MADFDVVAFDADDTLWHNEIIYVGAKRQLSELLSPYASVEEIDRELDKREMDNISHYGYGIKSFVLSMVETAIDLSDRRILASDIQEILSIGKGMIDSEVQLLENVQETIAHLAGYLTLMVITKGDLLDQERKLSNSGIGKHFDCVEIVSEKNQPTYKNILTKYKIHPKRFIMVGNSLKSDIFPVIGIGGIAVHIPAELNWSLDQVPPDQLSSDSYYEIEHMGQLPELIERIAEN